MLSYTYICCLHFNPVIIRRVLFSSCHRPDVPETLLVSTFGSSCSITNGSKSIISTDFLTIKLNEFLISPKRASSYSHLTLIDLITLEIINKEFYESTIKTILWHFCFSLLRGPNCLLIIPLSNTRSVPQKSGNKYINPLNTKRRLL